MSFFFTAMFEATVQISPCVCMLFQDPSFQFFPWNYHFVGRHVFWAVSLECWWAFESPRDLVKIWTECHALFPGDVRATCAQTTPRVAGFASFVLSGKSRGSYVSENAPVCSHRRTVRGLGGDKTPQTHLFLTALGNSFSVVLGVQCNPQISGVALSCSFLQECICWMLRGFSFLLQMLPTLVSHTGLTGFPLAQEITLFTDLFIAGKFFFCCVIGCWISPAVPVSSSGTTLVSVSLPC
jgi:hypothetical protein